MADPDLGELIERLSAVLAGEARRHWDGMDLHPVHGRILVYLAHANRYSNTLTALVDYLGATKGTVSQSLERLVERGLVERSADAADQRISRLALTEAGRRMVRDSQPPSWAAATGGADAASAATSLTAILGRLQQGAGRRTFGACRTCIHHQRSDGRSRCGLTGEALSGPDGDRWCREHAPPAAG